MSIDPIKYPINALKIHKNISSKNIPPECVRNLTIAINKTLTVEEIAYRTRFLFLRSLDIPKLGSKNIHRFKVTPHKEKI